MAHSVPKLEDGVSESAYMTCRSAGRHLSRHAAEADAHGAGLLAPAAENRAIAVLEESPRFRADEDRRLAAGREFHQ